MVIILQQSVDNGRHFISTVVEEDFDDLLLEGTTTSSPITVGNSSDNNNNRPIHHQGIPTNSTGTTRSSCSSRSSSSFSLTSQHSLSEKSAIYKQRIDSLFGRTQPANNAATRFNFNGIAEQGNNLRKYTDGIFNNSCFPTNQNFFLANRSSSSPASESASATESIDTITNRRRPQEFRLFTSSDDDDEEDYQKISDINKNISSIVTDSLNNFSYLNINIPTSSKRSANNNNNAYNNNNVTSVNITSDDKINTLCTMADDENGLEVVATQVDPGYNNNHGIPAASAACSSNTTSISNNIMSKERLENGQNSSSSSAASSSSPTFNGCDLRFTVDYLGSTTVEGNTTALEDLQLPLCNLYMNFLTGKNILSGQLAITKDGLRFEARKLRLVNSFTTIAVWAAIKFVAKGCNNNKDRQPECAFMPLISDPEGQDKGRLFWPMNDELIHVYKTKYLESTSGTTNSFRNPPIFACVMREGSYSLECHAFICRCAEDAIVIAANLYQSLVDKMKNGCCQGGRSGNKEGESGYGTLTRNSPSSHPNPNSQSPSASSSASSCSLLLQSSSTENNNNNNNITTKLSPIEVCCEKTNSNQTTDEFRKKIGHRVMFSDSSEPLLIPVRPPRRNNNNNKKKHLTERNCKGNLKRFKSEDSILLKMPQRRISINKGSNSNNHHHNNINYRPQYVKNMKRVKITTPEEESSSSSSDFHMNESIDQVLDRIINPGGMSFNDLKPSYQQLLLKIALTLTQDQLYQKSKEAMKKYQFSTRGNVTANKKKIPKSVSAAAAGKNSSHAELENEEQSQFLGAFLKSFSKITCNNKAMTSSSSATGAAGGHSQGLLSNDKNVVKKLPMPSKLPRKIILKKTEPNVSSNPAGSVCGPNKRRPPCHEEEPLMSFCSGCACDKCSEKCYCSLPSKHNVKYPYGAPLPPKPPAKPSPKIINTIESEQPPKPGSSNSCNGGVIPNEITHKSADSITAAAAAVVSTKICGYDTDSCAGSEKCYCSLQRVKSNGLKIYNINLDTETSDTDTNSYDLESFNPLLEPTTTTLSSSSNLKTVSTRSVEILSYNPARRLSYCSNNGSVSNSPTHSHQSNNNTRNNNNVNNHNHKNKDQTAAAAAFRETYVTVHQSHESSSDNSKICHHNNNNNNNNKYLPSTTSLIPKKIQDSYHCSSSSPSPRGILCNNANNNQEPQPHCSKVLLTNGLNSSPIYKEHASNQMKYPKRLSNYHSAAAVVQRNNNNNGRTDDLLKNLVNINESNCGDEDDILQLDNNLVLSPINIDSNNDNSELDADKVLSMKKTAEIAAMFTNLHVGKRQIQQCNLAFIQKQVHESDIIDSMKDIPNRGTNRSIDFEASLGYLP